MVVVKAGAPAASSVTQTCGEQERHRGDGSEQRSAGAIRCRPAQGLGVNA